MLRNALLFMLAFVWASIGYSAITTIQGKAEGFNNKTLKVGLYKDYITAHKDWIVSTTIQNNTFKIDIPVEGVTQVILRIEDKETSFFAETGKVYNLQLSYDTEANRGRAFDKVLDLKFPYPQANELNQLIKRFNSAYQKFFLKNYERMLVKGATEETTEFIKEWKNKKTQQQPSFVNSYITYALANLEEINGVSKKTLFENYLQDQPILYHQKEYINFFLQYFQQDFELLCLSNESRELRKAIMLENDLDKSRNEVMRLKKINDKPLAELYLMNGFFEVYHKSIINRESIINLLKQINQKGFTQQNKVIAANIIKTLEQHTKKQEAINFSLNDTKGKRVSLSDLKGKPVYLGFWSNSSIPSLRELRVMQKLEEKYGDKIQFVSINVDDDTAIFRNIHSKYAYEWTFLHYGNDYELREKFNLKTIPSYFLIDDKGKMQKAFAEGPTEIERTFYEMVR